MRTRLSVPVTLLVGALLAFIFLFKGTPRVLGQPAITISGFNDQWSAVEQTMHENPNGTLTSKLCLALAWDGSRYVPGVPVAFSCTGPSSCALSAYSVTTDPYGKAGVHLHQVGQPGQYRVTAALQNGQSIQCSMTVLPSTMTVAGHEDEAAQINQSVRENPDGTLTTKVFIALVRDGANYQPNVLVTFACTGPGTCTMSKSSERTDFYGKAGVFITRVSAAGTYTLTATLRNGKSTNFSLTVSKPPPPPPPPRERCGARGNYCPVGQVCRDSTCKPPGTCSSGFVKCSDGACHPPCAGQGCCADWQTCIGCTSSYDPRGCFGAFCCDNSRVCAGKCCQNGEECSNGTCRPKCGAGQYRCGGEGSDSWCCDNSQICSNVARACMISQCNGRPSCAGNCGLQCCGGVCCTPDGCQSGACKIVNMIDPRAAIKCSN